VPRERPLVGERTLDDGDRALGIPGRDALLPEAAAAARRPCRRSQPEQPWIVVSVHQVEGSAPEPPDNEAPLVGERGVDCGRCELCSARTQGEPRRSEVLSLHGQQASSQL